MEKQLSLIDAKRFIDPEKALKKANKQRPARIDSEKPWKLSYEDKQLGLAGVRAIRAILQQSDHKYEYSYYKAS